MPRMSNVCGVGVPGIRTVQPPLGGENVCHSDCGIVLFRRKCQGPSPPSPNTSRSSTTLPATSPIISRAEDFFRFGPLLGRGGTFFGLAMPSILAKISKSLQLSCYLASAMVSSLGGGNAFKPISLNQTGSPFPPNNGQPL